MWVHLKHRKHFAFVRQFCKDLQRSRWHRVIKQRLDTPRRVLECWSWRVQVFIELVVSNVAVLQSSSCEKLPGVLFKSLWSCNSLKYNQTSPATNYGGTCDARREFPWLWHEKKWAGICGKPPKPALRQSPLVSSALKSAWTWRVPIDLLMYHKMSRSVEYRPLLNHVLLFINLTNRLWNVLEILRGKAKNHTMLELLFSNDVKVGSQGSMRVIYSIYSNLDL